MPISQIDPINQIENHTHNGVDSPRISPKNLKGFTVLSAVPTYAGRQGEVVFVDDQSTIRRMYIYMFGSWRYISLI